MRYIAKELNVCFVTNPKKAFMTSSAEKKEMKKPVAKTGVSLALRLLMFFNKSYDVAANMVGIAKKKENSVAVFRSRPKHMAPIIVAPALDTPGKRDNACAKPMPNACLRETLSMSVTAGVLTIFSITNMAIPPAMSANATVTGLNR